ncbi:MAG: hypothetical protein ACTSYF_06030, partial [Promethearchaeota archaeon]
VMMMDIVDTPAPTSLLKKGLNIILIPVEVFTNSELHKMIENEELAGTPLESSGNRQVNLGGLDKDTPDIENVNAWVETVISIYGVTAAEAELILTYLINNASGAEFHVIKRVKPETLGVHDDVLKLIPMEFVQNSPTGPMPSYWWQRVLTAIIVGFWLVIGLLCAIGAFLLYIGQIILSWGLSVVVPLLAIFALLILQAVILVLAFFLLAISLLFSLINFLLIASILSIIGTNTELGSEISSKTFSIQVQTDLNDKTFIYKLEVQWLRVDIIKMELPFLKQSNIYNNISIQDQTDELIFPADSESETNSSTTQSTSTAGNPHSVDYWLDDFGNFFFKRIDISAMISLLGWLIGTNLAVMALIVLGDVKSIIGILLGHVMYSILILMVDHYYRTYGHEAQGLFFIFFLFTILTGAMMLIVKLAFDFINVKEYKEGMDPGKVFKLINKIVDPNQAEWIALLGIIGSIVGIGLGIAAFGAKIQNSFMEYGLGVPDLFLGLGFYAAGIFLGNIIAYQKIVPDKAAKAVYNLWTMYQFSAATAALIYFITLSVVDYPVLTVTVIDEKTNQEIEGAHVKVTDKTLEALIDYPYPVVVERNTSSNGKVIFGTAIDHDYKIEVSKSGYIQKQPLELKFMPDNIQAIIKLTPIDLELNVHVEDTYDNPITTSPIPQTFYLTRNDEFGIPVTISSWPIVGDMRFPQIPEEYLIFDDDYKLIFDQSFPITYDYLSGETIDFKYYDYYEDNLGEIPAIDPYPAILTPSKNIFIVRVMENGGLYPSENAEVTLSRNDYNNNPQIIVKYTNANGICRFENSDGLEYDDDWIITVTKPFYTSDSANLIYEHDETDWDYVDLNYFTIEPL